MSKKQTSLKDPRLAAVALVILGALGIVYWRSFASSPPMVSASRQGADTEIPLPEDYDEIRRGSQPYLSASAGPLAAAALGQAAARRQGSRSGEGSANPFLPGHVVMPDSTAVPGAPRPRSEDHCRAVFLSGGQPRALIGEHILSLGDRWRDYRVERITSKGVTLRRGKETRFLSVSLNAPPADRAAVVRGDESTKP